MLLDDLTQVGKSPKCLNILAAAGRFASLSSCSGTTRASFGRAGEPAGEIAGGVGELWEWPVTVWRGEEASADGRTVWFLSKSAARPDLSAELQTGLVAPVKSPSPVLSDPVTWAVLLACRL